MPIDLSPSESLLVAAINAGAGVPAGTPGRTDVPGCPTDEEEAFAMPEARASCATPRQLRERYDEPSYTAFGHDADVMPF